MKRLEQLDQAAKAPAATKLRRHVSRNSTHLMNVALAGGLVVLAISRLNEKKAYQESKEELEEKLKRSEGSRKSLERQLEAAQGLAAQVEAAVAGLGRQQHTQLKEALSGFKTAMEAPHLYSAVRGLEQARAPRSAVGDDPQ